MMLTLLSDFGCRDNFVGIAKGMLLQQLPYAHIVDLSHEIMPFHILQCSYYLKSSFFQFPAGTVHLSLFNIMHQDPARLLITQIDGQFILSADNGLLPLSFPKMEEQVYTIPVESANYLEWIKNSALFLKDWELRAYSFQGLSEIQPFKGPHTIEPFINNDSIECQIIHVDIYGNVITNLSKEEFEHYKKGKDFRIDFARSDSINEISSDYSNVPEGEKLARFNSGNFLEIAINKGSAAQLFGLSVIRDHQLIYQKIKIYFL